MIKQTQIRERLDRTGVPLNCLVAFCTFLLCFQMFSAFRPCFVAPIWILRQVLTMLQSGGKNRGKSVCDQSSAPWNILQSTETCIYLKPIFKLFQRHVCVFIASLRISAYDTMWKITCKCILCQSTALYLHWDLWDDWDILRLRPRPAPRGVRRATWITSPCGGEEYVEHGRTSGI